MSSSRPRWSSKRSAPGQARNIPAAGALLLPYQQKWVRDTARLKLAEKSRQIGWTWATAYGLVSRKALCSARLDAWVSSRDEIQARLFLEDCKQFATLLEVSAVSWGETVIDPAGHTAFVLQFANGLQAHSMSSNPDAQAGKRGDRVLDEFALHPDPRRLYAIAYPGITWGGTLEIFSTHRGSANYFNELIQEVRGKGNPKGFSLHRVTLQDALEQGFLFKLQGKLPPDDPRQEMDEAAYFDFIRRGCPDEETFLQEYCCLPGDDNAAFLSYELITSCENEAGDAGTGRTEDCDRPLPSITGPLFVGVDVGRDHDLTVLWVCERVGDVYFTRAVECLQAQTFEVQERALYGWLERPEVRRCCIDASGIGRQFAERAQARFGPGRVEPIQFTLAVKEELAWPVRAAFESRRVRIPNDRLIRADLRAIRKETTAAGHVRFTADRGRNGHADRFWALALALHAGKPAADCGPIQVFVAGRSARILEQRRTRSVAG
jgi:phage FluMu gp28-like protein